METTAVADASLTVDRKIKGANCNRLTTNGSAMHLIVLRIKATWSETKVVVDQKLAGPNMDVV